MIYSILKMLTNVTILQGTPSVLNMQTFHLYSLKSADETSWTVERTFLTPFNINKYWNILTCIILKISQTIYTWLVARLASAVCSASDCRFRGPESMTQPGHITFLEIDLVDHEVVSMAFLPLPLIQEGQMWYWHKHTPLVLSKPPQEQCK